ncbi:uncharacterized protein LOC127790484 [Diospyros lotus]|uniref:uncharacterized protein LOC127790484 n=1 Tax=Diospyros lotus TaxID=55363 RepID=UPI002255E3A7|nr:uncharacterized protein LOC127790484 [Diospyros lotus]XP_052175982.1 uncharacterized protein LOC127790484 [Diospyros lotus]
MKKNNKPRHDEEKEEEGGEADPEILKAVAQAWHGHSGGSTSKTANEFDARRMNFKSRPSRFKLEAMSKALAMETANSHWDFGQSLWDSYELVTVSKRLEAGLVLDHQFPAPDGRHKRKKESTNSLRNLFNRMSSRRFNKSDVPPD